MRVYEFARKHGVTSAEVLEAAADRGLEIDSPISNIDASDAAGLASAFAGRDVAAADAAREDRRAKKAAKAAAMRAEHAEKENAELEEGRRIAFEAAKAVFGDNFTAPVPVETKSPAATKPAAAKPAAAKPAEPEKKAEKKRGIAIELEAPTETAKITVDGKQVDEMDVVDEPSRNQESFDDDDDDDDEDASQFLHGKDKNAYVKRAPTKSAKKGENGEDEPAAKQHTKDKEKAPQKSVPKAPAKAAAPAKSPAGAVKIQVSPAKPALPPKPAMSARHAGFQQVKLSSGTAGRPAAPTVTISVQTREITVRGAVVVKELATKLGIRPNRLIADLMQLKVLASINQRVEPDVATKVAAKYGYKVVVEHARSGERKPVLKAIDADDEIPQDKPEQMKVRAPVVTFLGHVDHGKTTLMDYIRHTKVAAGEAGGITQQISAYRVDVNGRFITFLDTPGHAAFNAMRQRGAQLTDIAVIIIAADDGIMPQTQEAIKFARQAGVQIMVAITKCDKPTANVQRVKQMLQKEGLTPEDWGGDIVCCEVSGVTGQGVDNLLEMILLQADVLELTANPDRRANGYVIEAELEQGFGPSATLLVTGGTLKVGDAILIGEHFGKVRSLIDDHGRRVKEAPPSTPIKCTGLSGVPEAGAEFRVMLDEKRARTLAEETARLRKEQELSQTKALSLDALLGQMGADEKKELSCIVKSDTQGSLEAIVEALRGIKSEKVSLKIIGTGTGNVSLTDVKTASAGKAMIVGFDIGNDSGVQQQARHDGVRITTFRIIYELMDFVKKSMLDLIPAEYKEVVKGHAVVKAVYDIGKVGKIAGAQMLDGTLVSTARYRILRGGENVWEGKLQSLKHFKDEVKEVTGQQECGVHFANFEKFQEGDTIECYILEELPRSL